MPQQKLIKVKLFFQLVIFGTRYWVNSNKRKIGDNKQFMQIDLETGNFVQENHEILNIENIECRTTTNLIRSFDYELGYEKDMIMIRNKKN